MRQRCKNIKITSGKLIAAVEKHRGKAEEQFPAHRHLLLYFKDAEGSSFDGECQLQREWSALLLQLLFCQSSKQ